mgnify:CR=1 FL=1
MLESGQVCGADAVEQLGDSRAVALPDGGCTVAELRALTNRDALLRLRDGTLLRARPVHGPGGKAEVVASTLTRTWPLIEAGTVVPVVDRVLPLADAGAAHDHLNSGDVVGKVLLSVAG